jgi:membrane-associated protein
MSELLDSWLLGYPALALACVLSGLGMPVPEDVIVLYAGLSIGTGRFAWAPASAIVLFGILLRDAIAWSIGRTLGSRLLDASWFQRAVGPARLTRVTTMLQDHGELAVLGGRFLIGLRAPMFAVAGATGIRFRRFLLWDGLGLCLTTPALLLTGYYVGPPVLELAEAGLPYLRNLVVGAVGLTVAWWLWRGRAAEPDEIR